MTEILTWLLFGALFGMIAHTLDPKHTKEQVFGAMAVGSIGALNGGIIARLLFDGGFANFQLMSFMIMLMSIFALLLVGRGLRMFK